LPPWRHACANLAIPSAGSNALEIWGSFTPGIPCVKWQNVRFAKDVATAAEILDRAQNGTPGDLVYTKSGLQWWFAADKIRGLSNGAAIPTWNDNGLSARNLTQSTGGRRWTYQTNAQNGLAVARATGTDKFMTFPGGYSLARGVYTFHVALNYTPGQSGDMPLIVTSSGNGGFQLGLVDTDPGSTLTHFFSGNSFNFGVAAVSGFQVLSWVVGGGTVKTYRNGTLIDTQSYVVDPGQTDAQWLSRHLYRRRYGQLPGGPGGDDPLQRGAQRDRSRCDYQLSQEQVGRFLTRFPRHLDRSNRWLLTGLPHSTYTPRKPMGSMMCSRRT
jgi:hypothetical protein